MPKQKVLLYYESISEISYLKNILESVGYSLVYAHSVEETINKAKSEQPDMIYMDIMRIGAEFSQVTLTLRKYSETENIPIIFFSGQHQKADGVWAKLQDSRNLIVKTDYPEFRAKLFMTP
jgi:twitching motility two-component system response regulator PilH